MLPHEPRRGPSFLDVPRKHGLQGASMFIRKLRPHERAATTVNHICIVRCHGVVTWSGSIRIAGATLAAAGRAKFETIQEAEADGIKWARGHGTSQLLIDVSAAS